MKTIANIIYSGEKGYIGKCIESLEGKVDEIIILDNTKEQKIEELKLPGDVKIIKGQWLDARKVGFSIIRNKIIEHTERRYGLVRILSIDPDERLIGEIEDTGNKLELIPIISPHTQADGSTAIFIDVVGRLHWSDLRYSRRIHEQIEYNGGIGYIKRGRLVHLGYDITREEMDKKVKRNEELLESEEQRDWYIEYHIGECKLWRDDIDGAIESFRRSLEGSKGSGTYLEIKARKKLKKLEEAKKWRQKS